MSKWVSSSAAFADIVLKVGPLRAEINDLEKALKHNQEKLARTNALIVDLESKLRTLQSEYAELITQVQAIKMEMDTVRRKVDSSKVLLSNLSSEQSRWSVSRESSVKNLTTLIGDNIIAAAFCTYVGFFEHSERK